MAKKYQKRAHIQDRRAKEEKEKLEKRRAYYQAHKDKIWTISLSSVIAIILLALALDYFITPGGSMRLFLGHVMGAQENMIINNAGTKKSPRYFNYGTMETPEGFTKMDYTYSNDDQDQTFYYIDQEEKGLVHEIYVAGVDQKADDILPTVQRGSMYIYASDIREGTIASLPVKYLYAIVDKGDNSGLQYANLAIYSDVLKESSVSISLMSVYRQANELPTEEELVQEAEKILQYYHLPE